MRLIERAPAKINLTLRIVGRFEDGWHEIESLVAFAGAADVLALDPGEALSLAVEGPTAEAAGPLADNLVTRAAIHLLRLDASLRSGRFRLLKRLPAAAGIGGGSSDAAAALRLLAKANKLRLDDERLVAAARATGADVPVCLERRARTMEGVGEKLGPALELPPLFAVLANPGVALETKPVFAALGLKPGERRLARGEIDWRAATSGVELIELLAASANDMEPAACALEAAVAETLHVLREASGARLVRMSGSGATCFALFETCRAASRAAAGVRAQRPAWWVKATILR